MFQKVKEKIEDAMKCEKIDVRGDEGSSCGGAKIQVQIVSSEFQNLRTIRRHQKVNAVFADELKDGRIHALQIKALTPEEFQNSE